MGVYIPDMKMPTSCDECRIMVFEDTNCAPELYCGCPIVFKAHPQGEDHRPDYCPLVPVPPHGDLIDRDALRASIGESIEECHKWADEVDKDTMMYARISQSLGTFVECSLRAKAAPTIIQAEEDIA